MTDATDIYRESNAVRKMHKGAVITLMDQDNTRVMHRHTASHRELAARRKEKECLSALGPYVTLSARSSEMGMDAKAYAASVRKGYDRPPVKWGVDAQGRRMVIPIGPKPFFRHTLNSDVIYSLGEHTYVRCGTAYRKVPIHADESWRRKMIEILKFFNAEKHLAAIEYEENYEQGITDVFPLPFRIQLEFSGDFAFEELRRARTMLLGYRNMLYDKVIPEDYAPGIDFEPLKHMAMVDESKPDHQMFVRYLMLRHSPKHRAAHRIINELSAASGVPLEDVRIFAADDSLTGLRMLLVGGDLDMTFVLPNGSPLAPHLTGSKKDESFAGVSLKSISRRLTPANERGVYYFALPGRRPRKVVIADEAYPDCIAPESLLEAAKTMLH